MWRYGVRRQDASPLMDKRQSELDQTPHKPRNTLARGIWRLTATKDGLLGKAGVSLPSCTRTCNEGPRVARRGESLLQISVADALILTPTANSLLAASRRMESYWNKASCRVNGLMRGKMNTSTKVVSSGGIHQYCAHGEVSG